MEKIIQLTPYQNCLITINGKIRINSKHITSYYQEKETIPIDESNVETRLKTVVYVLDKLCFYVEETPEEIDEMVSPTILPPTPMIDRGDPTLIKD